MRLNSLGLRPYGALADTVIGLGDGLSVVYGLNEAGKSTLLSAYADLLCGIPRHTPMAEPAGERKKLRITAAITLDDGTVVEVTRTPKNPPNDLLDAATGKPVSAEVRSALTVGDHDVVRARFGLDHDRLVRGGAAVMNGAGSLADIVFEARTGTDLRALVRRLQTEVDGLYVPDKRFTSRLVKAEDRRAAIADELSAAKAGAEVVEAAKRRQAQADAELEECRRGVARLRGEHDRLTVIADAWQYWEQYRAQRDELSQIAASGPCLAADRLDEVIAALDRRREIDEGLHEQRGIADEAERECAGLDVDEALLATQPAIDTLSERRHAADDARALVDQLNRTETARRAELRALLDRLGDHGVAQPTVALAEITVPDDRAADLDRLAREGERLSEELDKARTTAREAGMAVDDAERAVHLAARSGEPARSVDPERMVQARDARDRLWQVIRGAWLSGEAIAPEIAADPPGLAGGYEAAVAEADEAAQEILDEAGALSDAERNRISALAAARATAGERRRALTAAADRVTDAERQYQRWHQDWSRTADCAGLPEGIGIAGWQERSRLLGEAAAVAEQLGAAERQRIAAQQTVTDWDAAADVLAGELGRSVPADQLAAWFAETCRRYADSKSNSQTAKVHRQTQDRAAERIKQLQAERIELDESLDQVAAEHGVGRDGLEDLIQRSQAHRAAGEQFQVHEGNLRATHPGLTLDELTAEFTARDPDQLEADVGRAGDALRDAEQAAGVAQEEALAAKTELRELTERSGADELAQDLSRQTAEVLDIIEEYAVAQIMRHLLTQELRSYVESHQNPVLNRAGAYLARLTDGRYVGLRAGGDDAQRSLIVIGADDDDYQTGGLSEGTAAQVYLALSLAGVLEVQREREDSGQERLPIMLDDVLMTFDDQRAECALRLLTEIGHEQQLILFTHHAAVREQAGAVAGAVEVVTLGSPAPIE